MLVHLPNKAVAEAWDIFKEIIRVCMPQTKDMLVDRLQMLLYAAMTNRIQCWLGFDGEEGLDEDNLPLASCYGGMITKISVDDLTSQKALLIYAIGIIRQPPREIKYKDFATLKDIASKWGCSYITAYCNNKAVANSMLKANDGKGHIENYVMIKVGE